MKNLARKFILILIAVSLVGVTVSNPAPNLFSTAFCSGGSCTVQTILVNILKLVLGLSGLVAVAYIVWGGSLIVTSAGNDDRYKSGKKTLTNAIIGLVIIILSYVIVTVVVNLAFNVK